MNLNYQIIAGNMWSKGGRFDLDGFLRVWLRIRRKIANRIDTERAKPRPSPAQILRLKQAKRKVCKHITYLENMGARGGRALMCTANGWDKLLAKPAAPLPLIGAEVPVRREVVRFV